MAQGEGKGTQICGLKLGSFSFQPHEKSCLSVGGIRWELVSYILQMTSDWENIFGKARQIDGVIANDR